MRTILVNPMDETPRALGHAAPRLDTLVGKTIGLLDISKPGGKIFLDFLDRQLTERYGIRQIVREIKPTFTRPATEEILRRLQNAHCDAVIEALAD